MLGRPRKRVESGESCLPEVEGIQGGYDGAFLAREQFVIETETRRYTSVRTRSEASGVFGSYAAGIQIEDMG